MTDDFNQLRPPNEDDDDERFDWEADESGEQPPKPDDSLGFTGELSWRQEVENAFSSQSDEADDDALDWQPGQPPPAEDEADVPDWLTAFTGEESGAAEDDEPAVSLPPWLAQFGDESADVEPPLPAPESPAASETPPWLREDVEVESFEHPAAPGEPVSDLPPWLENPELPADDAEPIPGGDVPPWLAGMEEPAAPEPAPTPDELLAGLDEALGLVEPPAEPEAAPDWMQTFDLLDGEPTEAQPLPGLDAYLVDEVVDDAFFAEPLEEAEPASELLPDWLMAAAPTDEPPDQPLAGDLFAGWTAEPEAAPEAADELPDWMSDTPAGDELPAAETFEDWLPVPSGEAAGEEPPAADDLFAAWEAAPVAFDDAETELPETASDGEADWLAAAGQSQPAGPQDIFSELGLPVPETGYDFLDQPAPQEDVDLPDWFSQEEQPAEPDWLETLGEASQTGGDEAAPVPADTDMLAALRDLTGDTEAPDAEPAFDDLDSLLASYESPEATPEDRALVDPRIDDIDRLLSDEELEQIAARRAPRPAAPEITPETPDWLTESGVFVGGTSAAAILRKQTEHERPLEELDDRLQSLRERGLELSAPAEEAPPGDLTTLLPGVTQFIPPTPIKPGTTGIAGEVALAPQQTEKIRLLRSLTAAPEAAAPARTPSALDLTYESPSFADLLEEEGELEETPAEEPPPAPRRPRRRVKLGRLVIALLVAAGVILPFFIGSLRVGNLPPPQFAAGSRQQAVFDEVEALAPGDRVLVAAEYGPTGAAELDSLTEALLRHTLLKGAHPVIASGNVLGLLHVQNILNRLSDDTAFMAQINRPLVANRDYTIVRYIAGEIVGLRAFSQNIATLLATDINGRATNLAISSLREFALIVVIAERAEDLRNWAEQVGPLVGRPLAGAVGFAAEPMAEPYSLPLLSGGASGVRGLLVGYSDAYTYRSQLDGGAPAEPGAIPTQPPATIPPTSVPASPTPVTAEEEAEATEASPVPGITATPDIPVVQPTLAVTAASEPTDSTSEAPATMAATPQPTAELPVIIGVINADQAVNVREGPGRNFAPVAAARPGERILVLGRNGGGDWLQIRLDDGTEGWIAASLVRIEGPATSTPATGALVDPYAVVALMSDVEVIAFQPEATPEATVGAQHAAPPPEAQDVSASQPMPYREERWYGMTLGLIVIIAVIATGTVVNVIGSLFRRRQR